MSYQVRFHLAKGKHYKHWQIKQKGFEPTYADPRKVQIELIDCSLSNRPATAKKIHAKGVRDVSGWVTCNDVVVKPAGTFPVDHLEKLSYDPIVDPYWRRESDEGEMIWDKSKYGALLASGKKVYVLEEVR